MYGPQEALRAHLTDLKRDADKGGYIPIPDHLIPPQVSHQQMLDDFRIFQEVFW